MYRTLLAVLLAASLCGAARAGEALTPEALLPSHEAKGQEDAYFPAAACGKDGFLVVWQAGRIAEGSLVTGKAEPAGVGDIVGARVGFDGKALDAKPFVISAAADLQEKPDVAFGGGVYLAVWQDLRNGKDYDVYAARVSPEGKALDAEGVLLVVGAHNQAEPAVAFDGKDFLVVWQDFSTGKYAIHGARVSTDGKALDEKPIVLGDSGNGQYHRITPAVSSLGDGRSTVFWVANSTTNARREPSGGCFVRDGKIEKTFEFQGHHYAAPVNPAALAVGPKGFVVAWRNNAAVGRGCPSRNANAAFFSPEGEKEPSDDKGSKGAFRLSGNIADPALVWDGARFVAAWHETVKPNKSYPTDRVMLATVSPDGKPAPAGTEVAGTQASPACGAALAANGKGLTLVVYERHPDNAETPIKVAYRLLGAAGTASEPAAEAAAK